MQSKQVRRKNINGIVAAQQNDKYTVDYLIVARLKVAHLIKLSRYLLLKYKTKDEQKQIYFFILNYYNLLLTPQLKQQLTLAWQGILPVKQE